MSDTTDFFDGVGDAVGAPTAVLSNPGDWVRGQILAMSQRDYIPFGKKEPAKHEKGPKAGQVIQQLAIVLQTENRNWANVTKIPRVDYADPNSPEKSPAEDDGKRAVYVPENKNIQFAIGRAVAATKSKFEVGGVLAVKITELKENDTANPTKIHEARYEPKADDFFAGTSTPAASTPAASTPAPEATPAPAADPAPAASEDPWGTPGPAVTREEPPF